MWSSRGEIFWQQEGFVMLSRCPDLPLAPYVECIWHYECETPIPCSERVLPDGRFQLLFHPGSGMGTVAGLRTRPVLIDPSRITSVVGVVFRPGAARAFVAAPAADFSDRAIPLDIFWGRRTVDRLLDGLRETRSPETRLHLVEKVLVDRVRTFREPHRPMHPTLRYALDAFGKAPQLRTVAEVSREIGWSRRWLSRAFAAQVGVTPKRYCRMIRFQHLIRELASQGRVDWAGMAVAGGFSDQAHLVHEFRAFSGLSPEAFLKSERPFPNHVRVG